MSKNRAKIGYIVLFAILASLSIWNLYQMISQYSVLFAIVISIFFGYLTFLFAKRLWSPYGHFQKHHKAELIDNSFRVVDRSIKVFASNYYDHYESVYKPIEIFYDDEQLMAFISKKYLRSHNQESVDLLIDRELLKTDSLFHLKSFMGLLVPILVVINLALMFIRSMNEYRQNWGSLIVDFVIPFAFLIVFIGILLLWNRFQTYLEYSIDKELTAYYSVENVCGFIEEIEKEEGGYEKEKYYGFNKMHMLRRINKLKKMNRED